MTGCGTLKIPAKKLYVLLARSLLAALSIGLLLAGIVPPAQALPLGFWKGHVMARNLVRGPQGQPIFAEFDEAGNVVQIIGEAVDNLAGAQMMAASTYREYVKAYQDFMTEHKDGIARDAQLLTVAQYVAKEFTTIDGVPIKKPALAPATRTVLARNPSTLLAITNPVLLESPIDLNSITTLGDTTTSVLLDAQGKVLYQSRGNIGYRTAYIKPAGDGYVTNASEDKRASVKEGEQLWGPVPLTPISNMWGRTVSLQDGSYTLLYFQPCFPGMFYAFPNHITAEVFFQNFNPKSRDKKPFGAYFLYWPIVDVCAALSANFMGYVAQGLYLTSYMDQQFNFPIDIIMLTGEGALSNAVTDMVGVDSAVLQIVPSNQPELLVPVTDKTEYTYKPYTASPSPSPVFPPRLADSPADLNHQGLLKTISLADLKDTDIYVCRTSNGKCILERRGLKEAEYDVGGIPNYGLTTTGESVPLNDAAASGNGFYYRLLIRGPNDQVVLYEGAFKRWQAAAGLKPEFYSRTADHLRIGEEIKIIAINRPTGYIGTITTTVGSTGGERDSLFPRIDNSVSKQIVLRPPNLRVWAKRDYRVTEGLTQGEEKEYLLGFEGSGLTSDHHISVITEWTDHDGSPLPEDLPGYTGRLAKVIAPGKLGNVGAVALFSITPGRHQKVIHLPEKGLGNEHFYIHISGQPIERNPNFASHRPAPYTPFRVPIFLESNTLTDTALRLRLKPEILDNIDYHYIWPYRPEMQFSLYDLEIEELKFETGIPTSTLEVSYHLTGSNFDPLPYFGPGRQLALALGWGELGAALGEDQKATFQNISELWNLHPVERTPQDYLALQLYQNDDAANALYEWTGLPLIIAQSRAITLKRIHHRGSFDQEFTFAGEADATDTFELLSFSLPQPAKVVAKLLDPDGEEVKILIPATKLQAGQYAFVLTYQDLVEAGLGPRFGKDFELLLEGEALGGSTRISHAVRYPGNMKEEFKSRVLGQIVQDDVLTQDGSLILQRSEFEIQGRGPQFALSRTYSNQNTNDSLIGQGWSHNLDVTLTAMAWGDEPSDYNLPAWVVKLKSQGFFRPELVPKNEGPLRQVMVSNGGLFKKVRGVWYPQRGYHGTLQEGDNGFDYYSKDGTRYHFDYPYRIQGSSENGRYVSIGDLIATRIGLNPEALKISAGQGASSIYPEPQPVRFIEDRNGNRLLFTYEPHTSDAGLVERVKTVTDAVGRKLEFTYQTLKDDENKSVGIERLVKVTGPEVELNYEYEVKGSTFLLRRAIRANRIEQYEYEPRKEQDEFNLVKVIDPNKHETQYTYYASSDVPPCILTLNPGISIEEVIHQVVYFDATIEFTYSCNKENIRTIKDGRGFVTRYTLNAFGNPIKIEEPLGKTTQMTWSIDMGKPDNVMLSQIDALHRTRTFEYDTKGNVKIETDPVGTTNTEWDLKYSLPLSKTDRNGNTITWKYDEKGNLQTETDAAGFAVKHDYNGVGDRISTTDARGNKTTFGYDGYGNLNIIQHPYGTTSYGNHIRGLRLSETDPNGGITKHTYDTLDYLLIRTDPDGLATGFSFDPKGNKRGETSKRGLVTAYNYDNRDRLIEIKRGSFGTKTLIYDSNSNLTSETDWKGQATTHAYNSLNQRISTTNRAGNTMSIGYDLVGNKISETDYGSHTTIYRYDTINRLVLTTDALGGETSLTYDKEHSIVSRTDPERRVTEFGYDPRYLLTFRGNPDDTSHRWSYDGNSNKISETDEAGRITTFVYNSQNLPTEVTDLLGMLATYDYDPNGNQIKAVNANGFAKSTSYDSMNRPIHITDEEGYVTIYGYDDDGNRDLEIQEGPPYWRHVNHYNLIGQLEEVIDAQEKVTTHEYDFNGNRTSTVDRRGFVTSTTYDVMDRPIKVQAPEDRQTTTAYDADGNVESVRNPRGFETTYAYDALHRQTSITEPEPDNGVTIYTYDKVGNRTSVTDARGHTTEYAYDPMNRLTLVTDPYGQTLKYTYDGVGNRKTEKDKRETLTEHVYDARNRLKSTTKADIRLVKNEYDGVGNITSSTDANGNTITYTYWPRNLLHDTIYPDNSKTVRTYNGLRNLQSLTDEENLVTTYTYFPEENRLESVTNAAGETEQYDYDANGNRTLVDRPRRDNPLHFEYDGANRLTKVYDNAGLMGVAEYHYDPNDNLQETLWDGRKTTFDYDKLDRLAKQIQYGGDDNNLVTSHEYDKVGNLIRLQDAKGQTIVYEYDKLNRETLRTYQGSATPYMTIKTMERTYDPNNNLKTVIETKTDVQGKEIKDMTVMDYDLFDRLYSQTQRGMPVSYTYEPNGNRRSVTSSGGTTTYFYDQRNRLSIACSGDDKAIDTCPKTIYGYYRNSKLKQIQYPNRVQAAYQYDGANRIKEIINQSGADTLVSHYKYDYDPNGNRKRQIEVQDDITITTTYDYDKIDRLTSFIINEPEGVEKTTYTLDKVGNRVTEQVSRGDAKVKDYIYSYNLLNELTGITDNLSDNSNGSDIQFAYDNNGNLFTKLDKTHSQPISTQFAYDSRDQLVQVIRGPPGAEVSRGRYDYNYAGMRIRHRDSERGNIDYVYDDKAVLEERNTDGFLVGHYRYADRLLSLTSPVKTEYYLFDALQSTVNLTDEGGATTVSYLLDPWGQIREQYGDSVNRQIFTGQEHDEKTGLIYFGARYYDPDLARFITQDSNLGEPQTPPSLHRYLYAYGNPTIYYDEDGHSATVAGAVSGFLWGAGQMFYGMANDLASYRKRSTGEYLSIWAQNTIAGAEIGASFDLAVISGGTGLVLSGAMGTAGFESLTFDGEQKNWRDWADSQVSGAAWGAAGGAVLGVGGAAIKGVAKGVAWAANKVSPILPSIPGSQLVSSGLRKVASEVSSGAREVASFASEVSSGAREVASEVSSGARKVVSESREFIQNTLQKFRSAPKLTAEPFEQSIAKTSASQGAEVFDDPLSALRMVEQPSGAASNAGNKAVSSVSNLGDDAARSVSNSVAREIGTLRDAATGKGNFGLGQATVNEAETLGKSWVGPNYRVASDGKTLVSSDGLRTYRPPSPKTSPYATTGVQANFERLEIVKGRPKVISNGHLNITP